MDDYSDIITKERPVHINDKFSLKHPKMSIADRAKIFSSFAALRGHSAYVKKRERLTVEKITLSPDDANYVSDTLTAAAEAVRQGLDVYASITFFVPDKERKNEGCYTETSGYLKKFNTDMGYLKLKDEN
ncbi:MAG: hypothetical protein IJR59_02480, partial [Firmicutes bacterium]|nr:hypothetical protein [Bacillota bacterium]